MLTRQKVELYGPWQLLPPVKQLTPTFVQVPHQGDVSPTLYAAAAQSWQSDWHVWSVGDGVGLAEAWKNRSSEIFGSRWRALKSVSLVARVVSTPATMLVDRQALSTTLSANISRFYYSHAHSQLAQAPGTRAT